MYVHTCTCIPTSDTNHNQRRKCSCISAAPEYEAAPLLPYSISKILYPKSKFTAKPSTCTYFFDKHYAHINLHVHQYFTRSNQTRDTGDKRTSDCRPIVGSCSRTIVHVRGSDWRTPIDCTFRINSRVLLHFCLSTIVNINPHLHARMRVNV